ncbi:hypothetical protein GCM10023231_22930 [Olivibacter ginsenosidimutans]|uniref:Lysoplasmalogenase n=1 Tax=Olivibacter ginsenosidimutans TaxID=1176537 RepID=A0ABP9BG51_9SPHI
MTIEKRISIRHLVLVLIIVCVALLRIPDIGKAVNWANFTPVGALALFAGTYFGKRPTAYAIPLLALFLSDMVINYGYYGKIVLFYEGIAWVYLAFAVMVFIGSMIKKVTVLQVLLGALAAVVVHWLITDFGVWITGKYYPLTAQGLIDCYIKAIPFEKNLLWGNLIYCTMLYGGFEWAKHYFPNLRSVQDIQMA